MNVAVIDDHILITQFVKRLLNNLLPEAAIRSYSRVEELIPVGLHEWCPDLIVCDLLLPGMSGVDMIMTLKQSLPDTKIILLTSLVDVAMVKLVMKMGIDAYLTKDSSEEELLEAVKTVIKGSRYVSANLKEKLVEQIFTGSPVDLHLSAREKEVLHQLCSGKTPKEIAQLLNLSLYTVQQYIKNMMRKFSIKRTTELAIFAIQKGLYNPNLP